jgi:uncharacterized protein (UPF0548 family)
VVDVRLLGEPDAQVELARLREVAVNYELDGPPRAEDGWDFDDYCEKLAVEEPGPPEPGGPFEVACRLVRDYEFADPSIIRGVWLPESPLQGRDMLLSGRFGPLRFLLGVRVSAVVDEETQVDDRPARVYGWCYRTLSGHLEAGEMCYRVVKLLDTGEVQFRVCRYVRTGEIPNPVVRLGWKTFGRAMQVLFVHRSMSRMRRLVEAELLAGRGTAGVPLASTRIEVTTGR